MAHSTEGPSGEFTGDRLPTAENKTAHVIDLCINPALPLGSTIGVISAAIRSISAIIDFSSQTLFRSCCNLLR